MLRLQTCMRWGPRQIRHSTHRALSQQCPSAEGSAVICCCFQAMLQLEKEPIKSYWVQKRSKEQICILPVKRNTVIGLNRIPGTSMDKQFCPDKFCRKFRPFKFFPSTSLTTHPFADFGVPGSSVHFPLSSVLFPPISVHIFFWIFLHCLRNSVYFRKTRWGDSINLL